MKELLGKLYKKHFAQEAVPRCTELRDNESCHRHDTVKIGWKLTASILGSACALLWAVLWALGSSGSKIWIRYEEAERVTGWGLEVAIAALLLLWLVSIVWTMHTKCTSVVAYLGAGLAMPFTALGILTPLLFATIGG
jgi:hypothetical protein